MKLDYRKMAEALSGIEDERRIPESVIIEALEEAMAKAYKKDAELSDINVEAKINTETGNIDIFQIYNVVEEVEDDELEMDLEEARKTDPLVEIGGQVRREVEITTMSRAAAGLARNVMRQKIREAEKVSIYNAYIDQLYDMVIGVVESVKDKFTLVNLGKTVAMMPKSQEIPGEFISEGQSIRVVITEVNKETRGSQVLVSRTDPMLVKRLFEKEVPEIASGIVEIKAIARDAGERTKMAVYSHSPEVDAIGACIGQRGARVQEITEELHGEKVDIFEWSDDISELVRNALAPAEVIAVVPGDDDNSLIVIVDESQLSLAIGKKGKNARLAVKLTDHKIDIKTLAELEEMGRSYDELMLAAEELKAKTIKAKVQNDYFKAETSAAEEKRQDELAELAKQKVKEAMLAEDAANGIIPEEMQEVMSEQINHDIAMFEDDKDDMESAEDVEDTEVAEKEDSNKSMETQDEESEENDEPKKLDLDALAKKAEENEYVSKFEKLMDNSNKQQDRPKRRNKRRKDYDDDNDTNLTNKELEEKLRNKIDPELMPTYTEEELEEIERMEEEEELSQYDIDYDEYEDFYLEEEQGK